jgi:predicted transcriptional regulator
MSEATFTFRVEEDLKAKFAEAAKAEDMTGAQLLRRFMRDYVEHQREAAEYDAWFRRQVEIGLESARRGELIPNEQVEAEFAARRAATLKKIAASKE